jgi:hypothetical protein
MPEFDSRAEEMGRRPVDYAVTSQSFKQRDRTEMVTVSVAERFTAEAIVEINRRLPTFRWRGVDERLRCIPCDTLNVQMENGGLTQCTVRDAQHSDIARRSMHSNVYELAGMVASKIICAANEIGKPEELAVIIIPFDPPDMHGLFAVAASTKTMSMAATTVLSFDAERLDQRFTLYVRYAIAKIR